MKRARHLGCRDGAGHYRASGSTMSAAYVGSGFFQCGGVKAVDDAGAAGFAFELEAIGAEDPEELCADGAQACNVGHGDGLGDESLRIGDNPEWEFPRPFADDDHALVGDHDHGPVTEEGGNEDGEVVGRDVCDPIDHGQDAARRHCIKPPGSHVPHRLPCSQYTLYVFTGPCWNGCHALAPS